MIEWMDRIPGAPHFLWSEVITGTDAQIVSRRSGLSLDPYAQKSIVQVAQVVERLRTIVGKPIRVTSGYRGAKVNGSQHEVGGALDVQVDGLSPIELVRIIRDSNLTGLRQVIAETLHGEQGVSVPMAKGSGAWVHIGIIQPSGCPVASWERPTSSAWLRSWVASDGSRVYRA